ncbi:helix-turn-helix transcriptional regulator [Pseudonocardia sp. GCM10023141]|uniref:helix-turn-helix transcriptional regulator n=1 Tax=Pseudonocardia sp. GCM10023141 TaxID=3252653 RepID=UPI00361D0E2C
MTERTERLRTAQDVADDLTISGGTLYQWRRHGLDPRARRVGRDLHYEEREVRDWFTALDDGSARTVSRIVPARDGARFRPGPSGRSG